MCEVPPSKGLEADSLIASSELVSIFVSFKVCAVLNESPEEGVVVSVVVVATGTLLKECIRF